MKLNDAVWGALLLLFSAILVVHVQSFPKIPGQQVGPALFPGILGVALGVCAIVLIFKGLGARREAGERGAWIGLEPWTRQGHYVLAFVLTIGVNVFYILTVDSLGFIVVGTTYLAAMFWVFGVSRRWMLPIALVVTLGIHYAFYKLLKVPLPWGLLQKWAW